MFRYDHDIIRKRSLEPKVSDDYSLSVCYKRQLIQGSPFTIKAAEKEALGGHWSSEPSPVVSVEEPVNLIRCMGVTHYRARAEKAANIC